MKLAMIELGRQARPVVMLDNGKYIDLQAGGGDWRDLEEIIEQGEPAMRQVEDIIRGASPVDRDRTRLLAPLTRPGKIMCIGKNYADHCREMGSPLPEQPVLFAKYSNALAGPDAVVELPAESSMVDYEAELAVVIGCTAKHLTPQQARAAVFGYCCANDLTMRDVQQAEGQWVRAKSPDSFCPVGPVIVTADEVPDPQRLKISLTLGGRLMQDSNTAQMVFGVDELISRLSASMTLQPGDLLLTGTPPGVGMGRDPQVFLKDGDEVCVQIERVGKLVTRIRG
ncbi:MAG: fumarylacetoacetate hydrolase family protein [Gemmatimonadota bacterium]|nr:fumarylacetoacetate hydrolase family protein [Gemmatimonadota bacterium]